MITTSYSRNVSLCPFPRRPVRTLGNAFTIAVYHCSSRSMLGTTTNT
ncbi:MAG: hypothetical protein WBG14_20860 [Rhodococcus sp. (in: high G+C Gram-positive bacteria)]